MSDDGNGDRLRALEKARPVGYRAKSVKLTADEARALIDGCFRSYGLDPMQATDNFGWRRLSLGSAHGQVGVVEFEPGEHYLIVVAPLLELPDKPELPAGFYRLLLELNHDGTQAARFSIGNDVICVSIARPIRGLDKEEVDDAIHAVMMVADGYDGQLHTLLNMILGATTPPLPELPNIKMTPAEAQAIGATLSACDAHGQGIFRYIVEQWQKAGYVVDARPGGIGLKIPVGPKLYTLAGMRPGVGKRRQLIILGWQGSRHDQVYPSEAIDRFQAAVMAITPLEATESTAHIEVTEAFDRDDAKMLLRALRTLAATAHEPEPKPEPVWDPNLPKINAEIGATSLEAIR
jgi:hypothetical protein